MGTERQTGYFGVAAATNVELAVNKIEHVNAIDVKELPSSIWGSSANPILLAFKYINLPFSIAIDVTKHEEVPVLVAAIDSANYVTLETDEGKSLTKATYWVRNNVKQFIHLVLPKNAVLWSVFVAGKPVKPAVDKNASILIPLEKSQLSGENLTQFPVEIVYLNTFSGMGFIGSLRLSLPRADIPISALTWSVYFPLDFLYFNFGGDVKLLKEGASLPSLAFNKDIGVSKKGRLESSMAQMGQQFSAQGGFNVNDLQPQDSRVLGVLPIKIDIPEHGRLCRFSKLLIIEKESPWLSVNFIKVSNRVQGFIKFLIFIGVLILGAVFTVKMFRRKKITGSL